MLLGKRKSSQKGFTLVEITVALGLIGLASLAVMTLSQNVGQSTKRAESLLTKTQFSSALGKYIYGPMGCKELVGITFKPKPASGVELTSSNTTPIIYQQWKMSEQPVVKSRVKYKDFVLKNLWGTIELGASLPRFNQGGETRVKTAIFVQADLVIPQPGTGGGINEIINDPKNRVYSYYYVVPVISSASGIVRECGDRSSLAEMCSSQGGAFNSATGECQLAQTCLVKGTFQRLSCSPADYGCSQDEGPSRNNNQTGGLSCPPGSVPTETGARVWTHTASCGKKCEQDITNTMRWYSCLKCP